MLLRINKDTRKATRVKGERLSAFGASGTLSKANYHGDPNQREEEYSMSLERFQLVVPPVSAAKIKEIAGANYRFLGTMFSIDADSGTNLKSFIEERNSV